jgi:alpha-L-fucosidase
VRWCGNERGEAGDPNWSTVDPAAVPFPGATGDGIIAALQHGDPHGSVWRPAEADVSIRPGWFYHPAQDDKVRDGENLFALYKMSVGRNSKLLLNVPPTRDGLLHERDVASLNAFRDVRASFSDRAAGAGAGEVALSGARSIDAVRLAEDITTGQSVARYIVQGLTEAGWRDLSRGTTIGYAKIDTFAPTTVSRVRVRVLEALSAEPKVSIATYANG